MDYRLAVLNGPKALIESHLVLKDPFKRRPGVSNGPKEPFKSPQVSVEIPPRIPFPPGFAPWDNQQRIIDLLRQRMKWQFRHYGTAIHVVQNSTRSKTLETILDSLIYLAHELLILEDQKQWT